MERKHIVIGILLLAAVVLAVIAFGRDSSTVAPSSDGETSTNSEAGAEAGNAEESGGDQGSAGADEEVEFPRLPDSVNLAAVQDRPVIAEPQRDENGRIILVNVYDEEEELAARREIARAVHGDDGPARCTTSCDCAPGVGCQHPPGICVPGLMDMPCCEGEACATGTICVNPDGSNGSCVGDE